LLQAATRILIYALVNSGPRGHLRLGLHHWDQPRRYWDHPRQD
jgi:hypothetical protein